MWTKPEGVLKGMTMAGFSTRRRACEWRVFQRRVSLERAERAGV
jgi:hypothetical protein